MVSVQAYMLNMKHLFSPTSVQQQNQSWNCHIFEIYVQISVVFFRLRNLPRVKVETTVGTLSSFCSVYIIMTSIN